MNSPWTLRFHTQPKIHKEGNPGIPVISSVNCHTSKISEYVDYQLQSIVKQISSCVIARSKNFVYKYPKLWGKE